MDVDSERYVSLFQNWFMRLDSKSKYAYYHGNCTVIDILNRTFFRHCKTPFSDYLRLQESTGGESIFTRICEYVMYILNEPIPKGKGKKCVKEIEAVILDEIDIDCIFIDE